MRSFRVGLTFPKRNPRRDGGTATQLRVELGFRYRAASRRTRPRSSILRSMMMFDAGAAEGGSAPQNGRGGSRRILGPVDFDATLASLEAKIEAAIRESPSEDASWAIVGIKRKGAVIARRLWESLRARYPSLAYGELDIALYRDDYHLEQGHRVVSGTELDFSVEGASIVLVDDVLLTGRA